MAHLVNARVVHLDQAAANSLARLDILARALARVLISRTMRTIVTKTIWMRIMVTITIMIFITITFEVLTNLTRTKPQHVLPLNNVQKANLAMNPL